MFPAYQPAPYYNPYAYYPQQMAPSPAVPQAGAPASMRQAGVAQPGMPGNVGQSGMNQPAMPGTAAAPTAAPAVAPIIKLDTVAGRTAADVYDVAMGQEVILIDIDNPCVYRKTRGLDNKLEFQVYDLTPHVEQAATTAAGINPEEFVRKETIEAIVEERVRAEVDRRLSEISFAPKSTKRTKVSEDE